MSFTTTIRVVSYEPEDFGGRAAFVPGDDAGIDLLLSGNAQLTEETARMFQQGKTLKITVEEV